MRRLPLSSTRALLIGTVGRDPCEAARADVCGWYRHMRQLGLPPEHILVCTTPALDPTALGEDTHPDLLWTCSRADLLAASAWLRGASHAVVTVSGHGRWVDGRGDGLVLDDVATRGPLALDELVPDGIPRVDWFIDLCRADVPTSAGNLRPGHVRHWSCSPGEKAWQRRIGGTWRGVWSWAMQTVLDQWTVGQDLAGQWAFDVDHRTLADRAAQMVAALGNSDQHSIVEADPPLVDAAVGAGRRPVSPTPTQPATAREFSGGWGIVLDGSGNCCLGIQVDSGTTSIRFGSGITSASGLPADGQLHWRTPTSGELAQLASVSISCSNPSFTSVGNGPGAGGGRLYSSQARKLYIKVKSDLSVVAWFTSSAELDANSFLTTGGSEDLTTLTSAPSTPGGGWYRSKDQ